MNILTLSYEFPPIGGGGARVAAGLAKELVIQGHQIDLFTMQYKQSPLFETKNGINIHRVPCLRFREELCTPPEMATYLINATRMLPKFLADNKIDINHTHFIFPDGILAYLLKKKTGLPYIITAHGSDVPGYNPHRFKLLHVLLKPFWRIITQEAASIVSPSPILARLIKSHNTSIPITVIPNGHDAPGPLPGQKNDSRVLVVTRLLERKGVQYLLRALENNPVPYRVDIAGAGPYESKLKTIARELHTTSEIHFHGWLDNQSSILADLFNQASIFVLPSEAENFPMVLLEAMAAGLAVITTQGTGCADVVGDTALLVEPHSEQGIREALMRLNQPGLKQALGQAARTKLLNEYTWQAIASMYIKTYQQATRGKANQT